MPAPHSGPSLRDGRPRVAALNKGAACAATAAVAYLLAIRFGLVGVSTDGISLPADDQRLYLYGAFAFIAACLAGWFWFGRQAKGPVDYRLLGRAVLQIGIGAAILFVWRTVAQRAAGACR